MTPQGAPKTFARTRLFGGQLRDEPITEWTFHHRYDVAVARWVDKENIDGASVTVNSFTDDAALGDSVFFLALLRQLKAMSDEGSPMVRAGISRADVAGRHPSHIARS
ncbi:MAG TPA: hypothetical protein VK356_00290, partial [Thermomicrobiales bacterium]|nr:hypothetical protein [Thermomicrobiales bacterium]